MNKIRPLSWLVCAGFAFAGGCAVSAEVEAPEICVERRDLTFQGVPVLGFEASMAQTFSQRHEALEFPDELNAHVRTLDVTFTATSGVENLDFIRQLRLSMKSDDPAAPDMELIEFTRDGATPSGPVLNVPSGNPVNTLEAWKTETALFTVEVAGTLPTTDWSTNVTACFSGSARYKRSL